MNNFSFCRMRHKLFFYFWMVFPCFGLFDYNRYYSICHRLTNLPSAYLQQPLFYVIISANRRKAPQSRREPLLLI